MKNELIPLEDTWIDVVKKSFRGSNISERELEQRSGLSALAVKKTLSGDLSEEDLVRISTALGLAPNRLIEMAHGRYHPGTLAPPEGIEMFTSTWHDFNVHSYLAWDPKQSGEVKEAVAFDTGADASEMLAYLKEHNLKLSTVFITHGHGDHVFDLERIQEKTGARALQGERVETPGAGNFLSGEKFHLGSLVIETRCTWGHAAGGITYIIRGLETPVAIVGDAIFAGSMGGPNVSYAACLDSNKKEILSLPPETLICPGHGPLTTVHLEALHNPFF